MWLGDGSLRAPQEILLEFQAAEWDRLVNKAPGSTYPGYFCPAVLFIEELRAIAKR